MAKQVQITNFGGPEVLQITDADLGEPKKGEVKLATKAIGINRADALLRQNRYLETPELPSRLGYDAAAEVIAVGAGVAGVSVGDRVITIPAFSQAKYGVYGEQAIVPANAVWPWPESLDAEKAACVGVQYTTVYFGLKTLGGLNHGDTVLLTAATGGVGFAAIEMARELGVNVIATTRRRDKADALLQAGADHVIVTDEEDLTQRVKEITSDQGVKLAFDPIAGTLIPTLLDCLAFAGKYIMYGILDPSDAVVPSLPFIAKNISMHGYTVFAFTGYPDMGLPEQARDVAEARAFLLPRLADGRLRPIVSESFSLDEVVKAHESLESNRQVGKIVLRVS